MQNLTRDVSETRTDLNANSELVLQLPVSALQPVLYEEEFVQEEETFLMKYVPAFIALSLVVYLSTLMPSLLLLVPPLFMYTDHCKWIIEACVISAAAVFCLPAVLPFVYPVISIADNICRDFDCSPDSALDCLLTPVAAKSNAGPNVNG